MVVTTNFQNSQNRLFHLLQIHAAFVNTTSSKNDFSLGWEELKSDHTLAF